MPNTDPTGRLQVYLVLSSLSGKDLLTSTAQLPVHDALQEGRDTMYGSTLDLSNQQDFELFQNRAKLALCRAGFTTEFVENMMIWETFRGPGVWNALKTLNDSFQLLLGHDGTDCCVSELVKLAVDHEKSLLSTKAAANRI